MGKTAKRPKKAKLPGLNLRQRKYVTGRLAGKSKKDSALGAGYSASMAKNAAAKIENVSVRRAFQELARKAVPAGKILKRLKEGLDATWVHQDGKRGKTSEPYYRERREYLVLAAKLGGWYIEKKDIEAEVKVDEADLAARRQSLREALQHWVDHETARRIEAMKLAEAMKPADKPAARI